MMSIKTLLSLMASFAMTDGQFHAHSTHLPHSHSTHLPHSHTPASPSPPPSASSTSNSCTNTCNHAGDSLCDDGGPGAEFSLCDLGTDCISCGPRSSTTDDHSPPPVSLSPPPSSSSTSNSCTNTCNYAGDSWCDDGGPDAEFSLCDLGTDCIDCGDRSSTTDDHSPPPVSLPPPPSDVDTHTPHTPSSTSTTDDDTSTSTSDDDTTTSSSTITCQAPVGSSCCYDDPDFFGQPSYYCAAGYSCGRGVCVPAGYSLCGCSGTLYCAAGTTCCGDTCCSTTQFCGGDADSCTCSSVAFPAPNEDLHCGASCGAPWLTCDYCMYATCNLYSACSFYSPPPPPSSTFLDDNVDDLPLEAQIGMGAGVLALAVVVSIAVLCYRKRRALLAKGSGQRFQVGVEVGASNPSGIGTAYA